MEELGGREYSMWVYSTYASLISGRGGNMNTSGEEKWRLPLERKCITGRRGICLGS